MNLQTGLEEQGRLRKSRETFGRGWEEGALRPAGPGGPAGALSVSACLRAAEVRLTVTGREGTSQPGVDSTRERQPLHRQTPSKQGRAVEHSLPRSCHCAHPVGGEDLRLRGSGRGGVETPPTGEAWTLGTKPEPGSGIFGGRCQGDREPWSPTSEISVCDVLSFQNRKPPGRAVGGRAQQEGLKSSRFLEEKQSPVWPIPP